MNSVLTAARLLLAVVFLCAGVAKLADPVGSRESLAGFGVPRPLAAPLGRLLPLAEVAVGLMLIPTVLAWWGALGALTLLVGFVVVIAVNLARGRTPECHCFGQFHSTPVGWPVLFRNLALTTVAALVVWRGRVDPGLSVFGWFNTLTPAQTAAVGAGSLLFGVQAILGWAVWHVARQNGRLQLRVATLEAASHSSAPLRSLTAARDAAGLPVGSVAPAFSLPSLSGETLTLDTLLAPGKPVLLLFTDPGCGPCVALLPQIAEWERAHASRLTLAIVSRGAPEANRARLATHTLRYVGLQRDQEVAQEYSVRGTPAAVVLAPDGNVASPVAGGADAIRALAAKVASAAPLLPAIRGTRSTPVHRHALALGTTAPDVRLPDLDGAPVSLVDFHGSPTILLFWNPACGHCERLLPDLRAWATDSPPGAPKLLVVSSGPFELNHELGLGARVVLDEQFAASEQFGVTGTPSAVLIDAVGRIASDVAVGAPAVLALIGVGELAHRG